MFCKKCGTEIDKNTQVCSKCGATPNQCDQQHNNPMPPPPQINIEYNSYDSSGKEKSKGFGQTILNLFASKVGKIALTIIIGMIVWGIMISFMINENVPFLLVTIAVCAFFGWKSLNKITSKIFLWMNFVGWIIYFVVKGFLSVLVGWIIAPFKIASMISEYAIKVLGASAKYIQNGNDSKK